MKAKAFIIAVVVLSVTGLFLLPACKKTETPAPPFVYIPPREDSIIGNYYVEVGYVYAVPPPMNAYDTVYGHCIIKLKKTGTNALRVIDDSITHQEFVVVYNFTHDGVSWYGDISSYQFTKLITSEPYDSINFSSGQQGVSHTIYTYWRGHKVL